MAPKKKFPKAAMKATGNPKGKITIRRHSCTGRIIEQFILEMRKSLQRLKAVCEDRSSEAFPHDTVRCIVDRCEDVRNNIEDLEIDAEYISAVTETKDVCGYFEEKLDALEMERRVFTEKKASFGKFRERLQKVQEEHFK